MFSFAVHFAKPSFDIACFSANFNIIKFTAYTWRYAKDLIKLCIPPIKNRILKILGVKRETVQSLTAEIRISEFGSKNIIVPIRHLRLFSDEDISDLGSNRIGLPPTYSVSASIMVAMWDDKKKGAVILGDRLRQPLLLYAGHYYAQILIFVDGESNEIIRQYTVGKTADDLIWANPSK